MSSSVGVAAGRARPGPVSQTREHVLGWRHLPYAVHSGARNMALDHALAASLPAAPAPRTASGGEAVLRLYGWARPTLSLGRNEPSASYPIHALRASGFDVVRRPTGGRAVLHDRELTYAVIAPLHAWGSVREAYVRINQALACALRELGADAAVSVGGAALAPDAGPCFQAPASGEVVARGRKVVGSAQARIGGALLQHGSILLDGDQGPLADPGMPRPIGLRELVGDVSIDEVARVVANSLRDGLGGSWRPDDLSAAEHALADEWEVGHYASDSWTHRR